VSRYGLIAYGSSLDSVGVLAKNAEDAAIVNSVIAGHDPKDSTSIHSPVPNYVDEINSLKSKIQNLRIGVPKEYFIGGLQPDVENAVREGVRAFERMGAVVKEISLPTTHLGLPVYYLIATAEASSNLSRFDGVKYGLRVNGDDLIDMYGKTRQAGFGDEVKRRIMLGTYALSAGYYDAYYIRAQKVRTLIKQDFERAYQEVDIIMTPVAPTTAFKIGEKVEDPLQMYLTDVFSVTLNLAGNCGISVPCGFDQQKLPIGMQLMGPALGETQLLSAAHTYQFSTFN
jgi:aspartyl-tRNA(Asn)/glutamyl-tRNA(Gln) amidotransferase subunit A